MRGSHFLSMVIVVTTCIVIWGSGAPGVYAGDLEPPLDAVDETGQPVSTMTSLEEIDAKLDDIYELIDQVCLHCTNAGIPATGQKEAYGPGDDGFYEKGVAWPVPRFSDNGDGTVKDQLTGFVWLKNANCFGLKAWQEALTVSNALANEQCGLSDGSVPGDWRLPNVRELHSLIDLGRHNPALPAGHPFTGVQSSYYWTSTSYASFPDFAWGVFMDFGFVFDVNKTNDYHVLPVRGGND